MIELAQNSTCLLASWIWRPAFPTPVIVTIALLLAVVTILAYVRTMGLHRWTKLLLLFLRLAVIGVLAVVLMGPSFVPESAESKRRADLYVMCDVSESMLTQDMDAQSRIGFICEHWLGRRQLAELNQANDVELIGFAAKTGPLPVTSNGAAPKTRPGEITKIGESLGTTIRERRMFAAEPQTILVLSDGIESTSSTMSTVIAQARARGVTIHTVALGGTTNTADATLVAIPLQDYLMPDEPGGILVKVYQVGLDDQSTVLRVRQGDNEQTIPVAFAGRSPIEIQVPIQESESGQYEYELSLDPIEGEKLSDNNSQKVFSIVHPRRIRVLMIEGQPFWDTKFLAESLRKDERVELTQVSQVTKAKQETIITRKEEVTGPAVPTTLEEWSQFDLVVLGRQVENVLPSLESAENLVDFVRDHGGHVVFARGRAADPQTRLGQQVSDIFATIEPVVWGEGHWTEMKLALTAAGRTARWFAPTKMGVDVKAALDRLPGFKSAPVILRPKTAALVLAESMASGAGAENPTQPALASMSFGGGSVVAVLGEGAWSWSLLSPSNQDLYGFYDAFWSNMIRWMVIGGDFQPGQQVSLRLSRSTAMRGESLDIDVLLKHESPSGIQPTISLTMPSGEVRDIPLVPTISRQPRFHATIETVESGTHELHLRAPGMIPEETVEKFSVYELNIERLQTAAQPLVMQMLAEDTGGRMFRPDDFDQFVQHLEFQKAANEIPPRAEYLWDRWWLMALLIGWLGLEWIGRRHVGLI